MGSRAPVPAAESPSAARSEDRSAADQTPQNRPLVVWDGQCGFCRRCVDFARWLHGDHFADEPYQSAHSRFPSVPREAFQAAVHFIEPDGRISRGAEAVLRILACRGSWAFWLLLAAYRFVPGFAWISEWAYRWVAAHRPFAARVVDFVFGPGRRSVP
jgi:predicted DCC family thiol-disulfide oxidoreductase YuxK